MQRFSVVTTNGIVEGDVTCPAEIALMRGIAQRTADVYENPDQRIRDKVGSLDAIVRIPKPMLNGQTEYWMTEFLNRRNPNFSHE